MSIYLFPNFLEDVDIYKEVQEYWEEQFRVIVKILGQENEWKIPWFNTEYGNGTPFLDGNPIFNAINERRYKALRIIQQSTDEDHEIRSWEEKSDWGYDYDLDILTIVCVLTEENLETVLNLIKEWIGQR